MTGQPLHGGRVSCVVPTRNSIRTIRRCLESLRRQTHDDVEIIVVDNFSTDGTAAVGAELADVFVAAGPERSAQRNLGLAAATGEIVGFIDSDMYLTAGVAAEVGATFSSTDVGAVVVPEHSCGEGFLAACRAHEKLLYVGNPDVEAARFFRTASVRAIGGYREDLRAGEDWELADRYEAAGHRIGRIESLIHHDDGRISLPEVFAKKRYYGTSFAHYLDVRPRDGARRLARPALLASPGRLARRPLLTAGLLVLKAVETSGLVVGVAAARRR